MVECYVNDDLIPSLKKKEGWTDIIYTGTWYRVRYSSEYFISGIQNQIGYGKKAELESFIKSSIKHEKEKEERCRSSPESIESRIRLNDTLGKEHEARVLIANGFYPTKEFLNYFKKLTASLSNRADGFLIKMKRKETYRTTNEAIKKYLSATNDYVIATIEAMKGCDLTIKDEFVNHFGWEKLLEDKMLPVVDGKIEVVEVKTGKGNALKFQATETQ